jgi:diaminopimelate decarboxylase
VTPELLRDFTAPFYLLDVPRLTEKYESFADSFRSVFPRCVIAHSYKTSHLPYLLRHLHGLGAHAEVVSGYEYSLARRLGVEPTQIIYNGPGKPADAVHQALARGSLVHLDSLDEVEAAIAGARAFTHATGAPGRVGLRLNLKLPDQPGIRSRFGLSLENHELKQAADRLRSAGVDVLGLHAHLTHQSRRLESYKYLASSICQAAAELNLKHLEWVDVGGGFGYAPPELDGYSFPSSAEYAQVIGEVLAQHLDLNEVTVIAEPGIATVGDAFSYFAPVRALKSVDNRLIAVVDGSVHTVKPTRHGVNLPTTVYDAGWHRKAETETVGTYDVAGYTCLEDDWIARDQTLPQLDVGDILAIANVGAYTYVFKPPFIRPRPAFLAFDGTRCHLVQEEERIEEMFGAID